MIGIAVRLKICVSNSLYNILLSGSIVWATRPIFDAPQRHRLQFVELEE